MTLMKSTLVLLLILTISACGAKDVPTLKADPAIHRTVVVPGDFRAVHERIRAKSLECHEDILLNPAIFENSELRLVEVVALGPSKETLVYYSVSEDSPGATTVDVYSQFKILHWPDVVETVVMGARGDCGCP
jgi:hypothetical protein